MVLRMHWLAPQAREQTYFILEHDNGNSILHCETFRIDARYETSISLEDTEICIDVCNFTNATDCESFGVMLVIFG